MKGYSFTYCEEALKKAKENIEGTLTLPAYNEWRKENPSFPHGITIINKFGSFGKAKEAASIVEKKKKVRTKRKRKFSKEDCVQAGKEAVAELGEHFGVKEYKEWKKEKGDSVPSFTVIVDRFDSWKQFAKVLGVTPIINGYSKGNIKVSCLEAMQEAAKVFGNEISKRQYEMWRKEQEKAPSSRTICIHFDDWNAAKMAAGLEISSWFFKQVPYSKEDCILSLQNASDSLGDKFSREKYAKWRKMQEERAPYPTVIEEKFGCWSKAMLASGLYPTRVRK